MTGRSRNDRARSVAIYVVLGLVVFAVLADRFFPVLFAEYEPLGDGALGLLLGGLTAWIVGEGLSRVIRD